VHSHWTILNNWNESTNVTVKLWRPENWGSVRLHLALSVLSIPSTGSQLEDWHAGFELVLSNRKSGIVAGGKVHRHSLGAFLHQARQIMILVLRDCSSDSVGLTNCHSCRGIGRNDSKYSTVRKRSKHLRTFNLFLYLLSLFFRIWGG
jgi:hypothetical protein